MADIKNLDSVEVLNEYYGVKTMHPLVSVVDWSKCKPVRYGKALYGVYAVFLKDLECGTLMYGRKNYDYQKGTLVFVAPGQVMGSEDNGELHQLKGWALIFHPDLLRATSLSKIMKEYSFFSYNSNEALHLSDDERKVIVECLKKIQTELQHPVDKHSKSLIVDNIKLFLDYCIRFYDRQFITREVANSDILTRFETLLEEYFASEKPALEGVPTVQYCADQLCLSPNYFSDLVKKETGLSALKHIQQKTLDIAKERLLAKNETISEVSYEMGFQYPQHFTRWFKKMEGCTPNEYRAQLS